VISLCSSTLPTAG